MSNSRYWLFSILRASMSFFNCLFSSRTLIKPKYFSQTPSVMWMVCWMTFWSGATISIISCSAGFQDLFLPKFDESKNRAKKNKMIPIQTVLILLIFNDYWTKRPVATLLVPSDRMQRRARLILSSLGGRILKSCHVRISLESAPCLIENSSLPYVWKISISHAVHADDPSCCAWD